MKKIISILFLTLMLPGCAYWRIDLWSPYLRSEQITSPEQEAAVLAKATLGTTEDGRIRVLTVKGSHYEMGYQQGALLREEVRENLLTMYKNAVRTFHTPEIFAEAYERLRPHIPQRYIDEMHGLAHGAKLPLHVVHAVHALPSLTEWGGKKELKKIVKKMMAGDLGTSCSNFSVCSTATKDESHYVVRILDWGLHKISKLHEYPLLLVADPDEGIPFVNIGWVGFLGAVSGMNAEGITLGEMGYGSPPNERLSGFPMPFLLRDVLLKSHSLKDVRHVLSEAPGTNSFVFLMSDGKNAEAELYVKDAERFLVFKTGEHIEDAKENLPGIKDTLYGGHFSDRMSELLVDYNGSVTIDIIKEKIIPEIAMKSNFQNVIYDPKNLTLWVNNAAGPKERAAEQPYTAFDFGAALAKILQAKDK
jgi:isopenicillin-N N-acyltransferase like protein